MQIRAPNLLAVMVLAAVVAPALIEPAFAGVSAITPVPGPIAAVGIPALIIFGGAYWLVRKLRARGP
jgi:hypothetical protein